MRLSGSGRVRGGSGSARRDYRSSAGGIIPEGRRKLEEADTESGGVDLADVDVDVDGFRADEQGHDSEKPSRGSTRSDGAGGEDEEAHGDTGSNAGGLQDEEEGGADAEFSQGAGDGEGNDGDGANGGSGSSGGDTGSVPDEVGSRHDNGDGGVDYEIRDADGFDAGSADETGAEASPEAQLDATHDGGEGLDEAPAEVEQNEGESDEEEDPQGDAEISTDQADLMLDGENTEAIDSRHDHAMDEGGTQSEIMGEEGHEEGTGEMDGAGVANEQSGVQAEDEHADKEDREGEEDGERVDGEYQDGDGTAGEASAQVQEVPLQDERSSGAVEEAGSEGGVKQGDEVQEGGDEMQENEVDEHDDRGGTPLEEEEHDDEEGGDQFGQAQASDVDGDASAFKTAQEEIDGGSGVTGGAADDEDGDDDDDDGSDDNADGDHQELHDTPTDLMDDGNDARDGEGGGEESGEYAKDALEGGEEPTPDVAALPEYHPADTSHEAGEAAAEQSNEDSEDAEASSDAEHEPLTSEASEDPEDNMEAEPKYTGKEGSEPGDTNGGEEGGAGAEEKGASGELESPPEEGYASVAASAETTPPAEEVGGSDAEAGEADESRADEQPDANGGEGWWGGGGEETQAYPAGGEGDVGYPLPEIKPADKEMDGGNSTAGVELAGEGKAGGGDTRVEAAGDGTPNGWDWGGDELKAPHEPEGVDSAAGATLAGIDGSGGAKGGGMESSRGDGDGGVDVDRQEGEGGGWWVGQEGGGSGQGPEALTPADGTGGDEGDSQANPVQAPGGEKNSTAFDETAEGERYGPTGGDGPPGGGNGGWWGWGSDEMKAPKRTGDDQDEGDTVSTAGVGESQKKGSAEGVGSGDEGEVQVETTGREDAQLLGVGGEEDAQENEVIGSGEDSGEYSVMAPAREPGSRSGSESASGGYPVPNASNSTGAGGSVVEESSSQQGDEQANGELGWDVQPDTEAKLEEEVSPASPEAFGDGDGGGDGDNDGDGHLDGEGGAEGSMAAGGEEIYGGASALNQSGTGEEVHEPETENGVYGEGGGDGAQELPLPKEGGDEPAATEEGVKAASRGGSESLPDVRTASPVQNGHGPGDENEGWGRNSDGDGGGDGPQQEASLGNGTLGGSGGADAGGDEPAAALDATTSGSMVNKHGGSEGGGMQNGHSNESDKNAQEEGADEFPDSGGQHADEQGVQQQEPQANEMGAESAERLELQSTKPERQPDEQPLGGEDPGSKKLAEGDGGNKPSIPKNESSDKDNGDRGGDEHNSVCSPYTSCEDCQQVEQEDGVCAWVSEKGMCEARLRLVPPEILAACPTRDEGTAESPAVPPPLWYAAGAPLLLIVLCGGLLMSLAKCVRKLSGGSASGPNYTP